MNLEVSPASLYTLSDFFRYFINICLQKFLQEILFELSSGFPSEKYQRITSAFLRRFLLEFLQTFSKQVFLEITSVIIPEIPSKIPTEIHFYRHSSRIFFWDPFQKLFRKLSSWNSSNGFHQRFFQRIIPISSGGILAYFFFQRILQRLQDKRSKEQKVKDRMVE